MKKIIFLINFFLGSSTLFSFRLVQSLQEYTFSLSSLNISYFPYYQVELSLLTKNTTETLLTAKSNSSPTAFSLSENWEIDADLFDYNSWISGSSTHYLFLLNNKNWFIGVFTYTINSTVEWELSITGLCNS